MSLEDEALDDEKAAARGLRESRFIDDPRRALAAAMAALHHARPVWRAAHAAEVEVALRRAREVAANEIDAYADSPAAARSDGGFTDGYYEGLADAARIVRGDPVSE